MNCVQGFVREILLRYGLAGMLMGLFAFGMVMLALHILMCLDKELKVELSKRNLGLLLALCTIVSVYILYRQQGVWYKCLTGFIMLIYLVLCSITDYYTQQVYDLIQLGVCVVIAGSSLLQRVPAICGAELIAFAVLQVLIFRRMYGEGDVMCFLICALSVVEKGIYIWVCHMGISFLLLGIVQGAGHNIASDGNLKLPVPFFPYMAVAYALVF